MTFPLLVSDITDMCEAPHAEEMLLNCYPLHAVFDRIDSFAFQVGYAWLALPFFAAVSRFPNIFLRRSWSPLTHL